MYNSMKNGGEHMFCRYCGREISEDTNFCPYCGRDQRINSTNEVVKQEEKSELNLKESNKFGTISIILLSAACVNILLSAFNLGLIVKYITLSISVLLSGICLYFYIKKKVKYDFLSFAISITAVLLNIGLIVYVNALI